jgi:hypothetical protein
MKNSTCLFRNRQLIIHVNIWLKGENFKCSFSYKRKKYYQYCQITMRIIKLRSNLCRITKLVKIWASHNTIDEKKRKETCVKLRLYTEIIPLKFYNGCQNYSPIPTASFYFLCY